jgi:F-type H+-transporting ATPase subunit b
MEFDATFWALVGLVLFLGVVVYMKVPGQVGRSLDQRAERIRGELNEARRLREEAQELLAEYQRRRKAAEAEAAGILDQARTEAAQLAAEAARKTGEFVARRTAMAEQKIAQAEAQAVAEVRANAVDLAVAAAGRLIASRMTGATADEQIDKSIAEIKSRLN